MQPIRLSPAVAALLLALLCAPSLLQRAIFNLGADH